VVELGDQFNFDLGFGSHTNSTALEISHQDITTYPATQLHSDHVGDFPNRRARQAARDLWPIRARAEIWHRTFVRR